jgi:hypothetical protein
MASGTTGPRACRAPRARSLVARDLGRRRLPRTALHRGVDHARPRRAAPCARGPRGRRGLPECRSLGALRSGLLDGAPQRLRGHLSPQHGPARDCRGTPAAHRQEGQQATQGQDVAAVAPPADAYCRAHRHPPSVQIPHGASAVGHPPSPAAASGCRYASARWGRASCRFVRCSSGTYQDPAHRPSFL